MHAPAKSRILVVSPYPVFPAWSGGKIRTVALSRGLASHGHAVTVVTPMDPRQTRGMHREEPFRVVAVPYSFPLAWALRDRPFPYLYLASFHAGLGAFLAPLIRDHDIVQFEHAAFAGLLGGVPDDVIVGYDAHNVESDYVVGECRSRMVARLVGRRVRRLERRLVDRSDRMFVVSPQEGRRFADLYGEGRHRPVPAPNGIDQVRPASIDPSAMFRRCPDLERHRSWAIYSGSDVEHNRRAVGFLLERVVPFAPEVGFVFQGGCGRRFASACGHSNAFFDDDHRSFGTYAVAGVVGLNPVVSGAGTNLKLLNYLGHGLPVISTPFGVRGYEDLVPFVAVCEVGDFLRTLREGNVPPLPDPGFLLERYSWHSIAGRMAEAYRGIADGGVRGTAGKA